MTASPSYLRRWQRGAAYLGCKHAIMGGAMTWLSEHRLVSAISNADGFGVLASGAMPPEALEQEIHRTAKKTPKPFGVNVILLHPQCQELVEVCLQQAKTTSLTHIVFAGGIP